MPGPKAGATGESAPTRLEPAAASGSTSGLQNFVSSSARIGGGGGAVVFRPMLQEAQKQTRQLKASGKLLTQIRDRIGAGGGEGVFA